MEEAQLLYSIICREGHRDSHLRRSTNTRYQVEEKQAKLIKIETWLDQDSLADC